MIVPQASFYTTLALRRPCWNRALAVVKIGCSFDKLQSDVQKAGWQGEIERILRETAIVISFNPHHVL